MSELFRVDRREFIKLSGAAATGLVLGVSVFASARDKKTGTIAATQLNAFVQVDELGHVNIWVPKSELGQGVRTSLPMIVAEELDADWKDVTVRQADADPKYGPMITGGSMSVRTTWMPLRKAGAGARAMLIAAAAQKWNVEPSSCTTKSGRVIHSSGKSVGYGELAAAAATLPVPAEVKLKDPKTFTLIGRSIPRFDGRDIVTGRAKYGIDTRVPAMLHASVERSPVFGGRIASVDDSGARKMAGVVNVLRIEGSDPPAHQWAGVAVLANDPWHAMKGRSALRVQWKPGVGAEESSETLRRQMTELLSTEGKPVRNIGDAAGVIGSAAKRVEAEYEFPFLSHSPMEPMNCTAWVHDGEAEVWAPTQSADSGADYVARLLSIPREKVKLHVTLMGGAFGRRSFHDAIGESVLLSKAAGKPVSVLFTREDDTHFDYFRPISMHRVTGVLGDDGLPAAWHHRFVSSSISDFQWNAPPEILELEGAREIGYQIPNILVEYKPVKTLVPRGWWRSVAQTTNPFVRETFIDELARAAGRDPLEYRLALLGKSVTIPDEEEKDFPFVSDRLKRVLQLAGEKSGWGSKAPDGIARGLATAYSFYSYVAHVVDVSLGKGGVPRVHRVVSAVDCGTVVNPDNLRAQIEGGVVLALTAALYGKVTLKGGAIEQGNFDSYPLLRMDEMPRVEVHFVNGGEAPTGVGEPGVPPLAPAVANALFNLTGNRIRTLPIIGLKEG